MLSMPFTMFDQVVIFHPFTVYSQGNDMIKEKQSETHWHWRHLMITLQSRRTALTTDQPTRHYHLNYVFRNKKFHHRFSWLLHVCNITSIIFLCRRPLFEIRPRHSRVTFQVSEKMSFMVQWCNPLIVIAKIAVTTFASRVCLYAFASNGAMMTARRMTCL